MVASPPDEQAEPQPSAGPVSWWGVPMTVVVLSVGIAVLIAIL